MNESIPTMDQVPPLLEHELPEPQIPHEAPPVQYQPQTIPYPAPPAYEKPRKVKKGIPGITGFGFTSALLALFLVPMYKDAFTSYLLYEGANQALLNYHYYASIALGSAGALFALLGAIFSPIGAYLSGSRERDGRALGVAGVLIAFVALILIAAITVSHVMLNGQLFPNT